jgi:hypothetical protein
MSIRVGINGFGRMGRLALRAAWDWPEFDIVHINEVKGGPEVAAVLRTSGQATPRLAALSPQDTRRWLLPPNPHGAAPAHPNRPKTAHRRSSGDLGLACP